MSDRPDTIQKRKYLRKQYGEPNEPWDKFREYLMAEAYIGFPLENWQARALFCGIQMAFDGSNSGNAVVVDPYLVHNMASCAIVELLYQNDREIPWDRHDDVLKRTYNGFVRSVILAVQQEKIAHIDGHVYMGGLRIPDWFVAWARGETVAKSGAK